MMLLVGAAIAASMLATAGMTSAQEAETPLTINPTPDDTWMTNGTVYSIIRYGDYIYVGGKFTKARSAATGGQSFAATNIARFDADTGVGDPTWTPDVTGSDMAATKVNALAAAGGKIWIGGKFEAVDGFAQRNLAAVSSDTGVVDQSVDPLVGPETSGINAIVASSTKVYVGGAFSKIDGKSRAKLAALDFSGNLDLTWKPKTDLPVRSLALSCDEATVFAGGKIRSAAGSDGVYSPRASIARFDATSGELHPWAVPTGIIKNDDEVAADLAVTCERITAGYLGPNFTRSYRLDDGNTGTLAWEIKSAGDVQTVAMLGAEKVVLGGHFGQVGGEQRTRIALVNLSDGSIDPSWTPDVDGSFYGPWDLLVDENHLYVGGAFKTVAGLPRTNFARFTTSLPPTPDTTPPETSITSGPQQGTTTSGSVTFAFSSSEPGSSFECSLDGAALSSCASPKSYSLADGAHTFEVKATDPDGNADATPASRGWTVDATAPAVQPPAQAFTANSTLGASTVPVKLTWSATDAGTGVSEYKLQQSTNGGSFATVPISTMSTTTTRQLSAGNTYQFRVQARDQVGNWSEWVNGSAFTVNDYQETSSAVSYVGTWTPEALDSAYGGSLNYATASGSNAQFSFTGSSVTWVATKNSDRGKATVWIDGIKVSTVDLYSSAEKPRMMVFTQNGLDPLQAHTLEVRVTGTKNAVSSGTRVDVDAFVVLS
jgi:hypothetical protein